MKPKNDAYYGSLLFKLRDASQQTPGTRFGLQEVKVVDSISAGTTILPDEPYIAMKQVRSLETSVMNLFVDSRGRLVYRRSSNVNIDLNIQNGTTLVASEIGGDEE